MSELIDSLLAFARLGQADLKKSTVDLNALISDILIGLQADTKARKITWNLPALPPVQADPALMRVVLTNLLSNAVKFTGPREEAKIEIGNAPSQNGEKIFFIGDNGVGFEPAHAGKLFGVFQRLDTPVKFEGLGIGLANVRRIINRHGGRTWAEGVPGVGATFYFSLPK